MPFSAFFSLTQISTSAPSYSLCSGIHDNEKTSRLVLRSFSFSLLPHTLTQRQRAIADTHSVWSLVCLLLPCQTASSQCFCLWQQKHKDIQRLVHTSEYIRTKAGPGRQAGRQTKNRRQEPDEEKASLENNHTLLIFLTFQAAALAGVMVATKALNPVQTLSLRPRDVECPWCAAKDCLSCLCPELFPPWSSQARLEGTRCKISQCLVSVLCNETPSFGLRRFPLPNLPLLPDPQQPHPSFTLLLTSSSSATTVGRDEVWGGGESRSGRDGWWDAGWVEITKGSFTGCTEEWIWSPIYIQTHTETSARLNNESLP